MKKLTIALVAHDNRKAEMVEWAVHNAEFLSHHHIVCTGTTGNLVRKALEEKGVERKILLHQGEHVYVYDLEGSGTLDMVERWLDHYLKGIDNGIDKEPKVLVESNLDQLKWMAS